MEPLFDTEQYLIPYWTGDTMYDEAAFVLESADGGIEPISLLYQPDEILRVTDSTLTVTYEEGRDYVFEDGVLRILPDGTVPCMNYKEYYLDEPIEGKSFMRQNGKWLAFAETVLMYPKQIAVTYRHHDRWDRYIPAAQGAKLPRLLHKLSHKEPVRILLFGDSICAGGNATSRSGRSPYQPMFIDLFVNELRRKYGYDDITFVNTSVGGKSSAWGRETVEENALAEDYDLAIIGFGMNNSATPLSDFKEDIRVIRDRILEKHPETECILIATMVANEELKGFWGMQNRQQEVLYELADEGEHTVVANMTEYHLALLKTKHFYDMTGNNVNHPNDFLIRGYAHLLLRTVEE